MKKKAEIYSRVENYLKQPINLLESLGQIEDAEILRTMRHKYQQMVCDEMRKHGISKLSVSLGRNYECNYELRRANEKIN